MKKHFVPIFIVSFLIPYSLFFIPVANASSINFQTTSTQIVSTQTIRVDVTLNTEDADINAIQGKIRFPKESLELKEIRDANSIVSLWVTKPTHENNLVNFAGTIPGGFNGKNGLLFSLIFTAIKNLNPNTASLELADLKALKNDGLGSSTEVSTSALQFAIAAYSESVGNVASESAQREGINDTILPENFTPKVASDASLYNGDWFVVFDTTDKQSGISHYEIQESKVGLGPNNDLWISATSPYLLKDQTLSSFIYIKATDKQGNIRIATLLPKNSASFWERNASYIVLGILSLIVLTLLSVIFYLIRHIRKTKKILN